MAIDRKKKKKLFPDHAVGPRIIFLYKKCSVKMKGSIIPNNFLENAGNKPDTLLQKLCHILRQIHGTL